MNNPYMMFVTPYLAREVSSCSPLPSGKPQKPAYYLSACEEHDRLLAEWDELVARDYLAGDVQQSQLDALAAKLETARQTVDACYGRWMDELSAERQSRLAHA